MKTIILRVDLWHNPKHCGLCTSDEDIWEKGYLTADDYWGLENYYYDYSDDLEHWVIVDCEHCFKDYLEKDEAMQTFHKHIRNSDDETIAFNELIKQAYRKIFEEEDCQKIFAELF